MAATRRRRGRMADEATAAEIRKVLRTLARAGGRARAKALTPAERKRIGRLGGLAKARAARAKKGAK